MTAGIKGGPGRPPKTERIIELIDLVRLSPGQYRHWYATRLGVGGTTIARIIAQAHRLGYGIDEQYDGRLYVTGNANRADDSALQWLDQPVTRDAVRMRNLLAAVMLVAVEDAECGNAEALEWLRGNVARHYADLLDMDHDDIVARIERRRADRRNAVREMYNVRSR